MRYPLMARTLGLWVVLVLFSAPAFAADMRVLIDRDCSKCHREQTADLAQKGGAHKAQFQCRDCHSVHPRFREKIPVDCLGCHARASVPHFPLDDCVGCHHGHHPLDTDFSRLKGSAAKVCQSCHQVELPRANSLHAPLGCSECHGKHRQKPDCLGCHESHDESIKGAHCVQCHPAHNPAPVVIQAKVPSAFCAACHPETTQAFEASGGAHQRALGCSGCHQKHAPAKEPVPECSRCHKASDSAHFALGKCRDCHNPHAPAVGDFSAIKSAQPVCATCHGEQSAALGKGGVSHGGQDCNLCHQRHGKSPSCLQCHQGHSEGMGPSSCRSCHAPHDPMPPRLKGFIDARLCGTCHQEQAEQFMQAGKSHKILLGCNGCHETHPPTPAPMPECSNCHGQEDSPHYAVGGCINCHNPHAPVVKDLSALEASAQVCGSCHQGEAAGLENRRNPHNGRQCNDCHGRHGESSDCTSCHEAHAPSMNTSDCLRCHNPHDPLGIHPEQGIPPQLCAACHKDQAGQIIQSGGAHRDKLNCAACHRSHPEAGCLKCHAEHPGEPVAAPPRCNACHTPTARPHFAVGGCTDCHSPHHPREVDLERRSPVFPVCLGCHQAVGELQASRPGAHSRLDCFECHPRHGEKRLCADCHTPHAPSVSQKDCRFCHGQHHAPARVSFGEEVPMGLCAPCHAEQAGALSSRPSAHSRLPGCVSCHPDHPQKGQKSLRPGMEQNWSADCGKCHNRLLKRHYTANGCTSCHSPHDPKTPRLGAVKDAREGCSSCHFQQGRLSRVFPSRHTGLDCRQCHDGHKGKKRCVDCHQPHGAGMSPASCTGCHPAHYPRIIEFGKEISAKDCLGCHGKQAAVLSEKGGAHANLACNVCHKGHPPRGKEVIPECVDCHRPGRNKHFRIQGCALCHQAHAPAELDFIKPGTAAPACASCHGAQFKEMAANPSAHSRQDCSACHPDHGSPRKCVECHQPHFSGMATEECSQCHLPHAPREVRLHKGQDARTCSACHPDQGGRLAKSAARHNRLSCLDCHFGRHGEILSCETCHVPPHEPGLHARYPDCLSCHPDPHDLEVKRKAAPGSPPPPVPAVPQAPVSEQAGEKDGEQAAGHK